MLNCTKRVIWEIDPNTCHCKIDKSSCQNLKCIHLKYFNFNHIEFKIWLLEQATPSDQEIINA